MGRTTVKFNTLKATFKGGMVSPRLRGREKDGDLTSTAEKLENFATDKIGGISRRLGLEMPHVQPFVSTNDGSFTYDSKPFLETTEAVYFTVHLRGREWIFRFDLTKAFNAIVNTVNPVTPAEYQSTYLSVIDPLTGDYKDTRPYAPYYTGAGDTFENGDLTVFTYSLGAPVVKTELGYYLSNLFPRPTHISKVTDATVVFTCGNSSNSISNISFAVSLVNLPVISQFAPTTEVFVMLPYFVNIRAFVANLGKSFVDATYYNVIQPTNFPFNVVNPNKALTVSIALISGQSGATTPDKVLTTPGNKLVYEITVPKDMSLDIFFSTGSGYTTPDALLGRFIIIPSADNLFDCVFFITRFTVSVGNTYKFICMQITGGTPEANSSRWRLSTFGGQSHPRTVAYCFNRLVYGNAGIEESGWWASAIHPSAITNFQGFMQFSLLQDASSDVSHLLYEGIASPTATDIYRYGMQSRVPNLAPISFISSRRRIHFGTLAGECQLTINNGTFNAFSFDQLIVRSNSASLAPSPSGDGKFFYLSKDGKDIRFISTEDKDYESVDGLVSTALEGLNLVFNKIEWYEELNSIVARTTDNRFFFITMHADTEIKAITEIVSELELIDFSTSLDNLYFIYNYKGYTHISRYGVNLHTLTDDPVDFPLSGDIGVFSPSTTGQNRYQELANFSLGDDIQLFFNGVEYTWSIPLSYDGDESTLPALPVDISGATAENPAFFYSKRVKVKLRTLPVSDGGGNNSAMGDIVRIDRLVVQIDRSGPFKMGMEGGTIYDAEGLSMANLQTKYVKYDMPQSPDIENHFYLESDKPTPLNISGISYRGVSYQGE